MTNQAKHVIVVGGGMAGLAASCSLAQRGVAVTLLEAASQLGGRARSVAIEFNSQVIQLDNGQHIMLGAYRETLKLLASIGVQEEDAFLRVPLTLDVRAGNQTAFKVCPPAYLPAPLNQLIGFLCCKGLQWCERVAVIQFMLRLKKSNYQLAADEPLAVFLQSNQQSSNATTLLWEPLCLAALNTPINIASSKVFLNVLRDTFKSKNSADFLLPKHDLSQLFSQPVESYFKAIGKKIILNQRVKNITPNQNGFTVSCKPGLNKPGLIKESQAKESSFEASHVIVTTSPARLRNVIADLPKLDLVANQTESYEYQPIYTVYLQYQSNVTISAPMLGLIGGVSQWVFDRGILCGQHGLMAVIISAEGQHQQLTQDALALKVAQELKASFPQLAQALWHKVIAEKRATFSCTVNLPRPTHATPYPNLYLAGDYTYADYPATIEGAVRSGVACADLVCNS
jgi:squalene-associated FAD-dependent desaturase